MLKTESVPIRGAVAGFLAAFVLALWFLVVDTVMGAPLRTPALMAESLFGVEDMETRAVPIALYTLVHFAVFVVVGIGVAHALERMKIGPSLILGVVLGFLLFDIVFFGSIYVTGIDVVAEVGWIAALSGNMLAGVALMAYLRISTTRSTTFAWERLADHQIVREGLLAGLIGAVTVAAWFLLIDIGQGRPFFTPGALGSAIFLGISDVAEVDITLLTVGGYTVLHFVAFAAVGLLASGIAGEAEERPAIILGAILLFVAFEAFFMGLMAVLAEFLLGPLAWWSIALGNLLAVLAMGYYLWRRHPRLRRALDEDPFDRVA